MSDLLSVLRATGARRPVLMGVFSTGSVHVLLAAMRPTLPRALVWLEPTARYGWAPDYPWGLTDEQWQLQREFIHLWGTVGYGKAFWEEEEAAGNPMPIEAIEHTAFQTRNACTPDVAERLTDIWYEADVRSILPSVKTPTLLLVHEERESSVEEANYIASKMPAAEVRVMPGLAWSAEEHAAWVEAIRDFVGIARPHPTLGSVLSTVLFTDIVGSTERQAEVGDRSWTNVLQRHHSIVRDALKRWQGEEIDTAGDGFYATFDGPARAIRSAFEVSERVRELGIEIRAGIHTGECEMVDGKPGGLAVSVGARVAAVAGPSEVLVSGTVRDLVAGSGLRFEDAGEHELKGVPGKPHLYRVVA